MEDIGDAQAVSVDDVRGFAQHMRELAERHRAVHADIVGDTAGGAEGRLAAFPDRRRFHRRLAFLDALDVVLPGDRDDLLQHRVHLVVRALDLDDQQRLDIHRIAGMGEGLADVDRRLVHEFDGDRNDAVADDVGDAGPGTSEESKPNSTGRAPSGLAISRTVASVTMPSWPSEPQTRPSRS
jgi:hypothetical protein